MQKTIKKILNFLSKGIATMLARLRNEKIKNGLIYVMLLLLVFVLSYNYFGHGGVGKVSFEDIPIKNWNTISSEVAKVSLEGLSIEELYAEKILIAIAVSKDVEAKYSSDFAKGFGDSWKKSLQGREKGVDAMAKALGIEFELGRKKVGEYSNENAQRMYNLYTSNIDSTETFLNAVISLEELQYSYSSGLSAQSEHETIQSLAINLGSDAGNVIKIANMSLSLMGTSYVPSEISTSEFGSIILSPVDLSEGYLGKSD